MGFSCGIVGLPRVGKTSIFNALTASNAQVGAFTGASADPNIAMVNVPDPRLDDLGKVNKSRKITPTTLQFVDVAGLCLVLRRPRPCPARPPPPRRAAR